MVLLQDRPGLCRGLIIASRSDSTVSWSISRNFGLGLDAADRRWAVGVDTFDVGSMTVRQPSASGQRLSPLWE